MRYIKFIFAIAVIASACGMASAQKGMQGIGVNLGFRYEVYLIDGAVMDEGIVPGVDLKYQYNVNNFYRLEPFLSFDMRSGQKDVQVGLNNHIFMSKVKRFRPYFIMGVGFSWMEYTGDLQRYWKNENDNVYLANSLTSNSFYWRGGFGGDYRFTHTLSGQIELCMAGIAGGYFIAYPQVRIGVAYNF